MEEAGVKGSGQERDLTAKIDVKTFFLFFCHNAGVYSTGSGILAVLVSLRSASSVCLVVVESRQIVPSCNPGLKIISAAAKAQGLLQCAKV